MGSTSLAQLAYAALIHNQLTLDAEVGDEAPRAVGRADEPADQLLRAERETFLRAPKENFNV